MTVTTSFSRSLIFRYFWLAATIVAIGGFIGALPWETSLAAFLAAICIWAGYARPDVALAFIALSVPVQRTLLLGYGDTAVTVTKVVLWSVVAGWMAAQWRFRRSVYVSPIFVAICAMGVALVLSGWNARDGGLWMGETYRWLAGVPVFLMAFNVYRRQGSVTPFVVGSFIGTAWCTLMAVGQVVNSIGPPSFESRGLMRAAGPFTHPNQLALFLETTTPLLLAIALARMTTVNSPSEPEVSGLVHWLAVAGSALGLLGLVLSQSRGGSVGMTAGVLAVLALSFFMTRFTYSQLAAPVIVAFILLTGGITFMIGSDRLDLAEREVNVTPSNFAVEERIAHWVAGVEMAKEHPWLGVGAGNYDTNFRESTHSWRFRIGRGHAHNTELQMLAQSGVIGLVVYLGMLATAGLVLANALDRAVSPLSRALVVGVIGITVALVAHGLFEYVHVLSLNLQLMIAWGLAAAIGSGILSGEHGRLVESL